MWSPQNGPSPGASGSSGTPGSGQWRALPPVKGAKNEVEEGDDDEDDASQPGEGPAAEVKKKSTRGSRACTVCRKLKMRCVGAEEGPPCKRCKTGGHEVR